MKRHLFRLACFTTLLCVLQGGLYYGFATDRTVLSKRLDAALRRKLHIVFMGDSSVHYRCRNVPKTIPQVPMSDYLAEHLAPLKVLRLSSDAYHPGIYLAYMQRMVASKKKPRCVVMPINMRCFSQGWDGNPQWQFTDEVVWLYRYTYPWLPPFYGFMDSLDGLKYLKCIGLDVQAPMSREAFDRYRRALKRTPLPEKFVDLYLAREHDIGSHRRMRALVEIDRLGHEHGITVVFYFTPTDYEFLTDEVPDFVPRFKALVGKVKGMLRHSLVVDLSMAYGREYFQHNDTNPNEHICVQGKKGVARQLAAFIRKRI